MAAKINPGIVYMTASLVLFAVAVVLHFHSLHLSLPIPAAVTILTVIIPIAAFLNAFVYPNLLRDSSTSSSSSSSSSPSWQRLLPGALQGLQAILAAVLATLLAQGFASSPATRACALDAAWDALYRARDADAVRLVQDTLGCCGYSDVDDRAFPFASLIQQTCAQIYGRDRACAAPWRAAMETHAGIAFGVVMAVALMQVLGLVLMRPGTSWWTALRTPEDEEADDGYDERSRLLGGERGSQQATTSSPVAGPSTYAEAAR
ncbi:iron transport multicopper oxidase FET3 precursor [Cordyceps fumosorosea ARSEF 2679]|uniref:Iron transport multicopper oxidase FET3 n=1 Tax=Cordyceps fumosorosea (strain ARSEF 2679) TaxID=1081104 RepID=A0A167MX92_CORFA|nr:iron transport multicopper oxidase FET3 precursor [Cordyceps fumosorosea ARSEF 2679]OAA54861.1 iron transport multicopper oxidase FET3 precursor [Cordyceps fumosorosea ARSEF 2679]